MSEAKEIKRLYRSRQDKVIAGVCGGVAEYLNVDPVVVRVLAVLSLFTGIGFFLYIAAIFIVPENQAQSERVDSKNDSSRSKGSDSGGVGRSLSLIIGALFIVFGGLIILEKFDLLDAGWFHFSFIPWRLFWPVLLIVVGVLLLTNSSRASQLKDDAQSWVRKNHLERSRTDKALAGVCGGLAKTLNIDSGIVRLGVVLLTLFTGGFALLLYVVMAFIMPQEQLRDEVVVEAETVDAGAEENGQR